MIKINPPRRIVFNLSDEARIDNKLRNDLKNHYEEISHLGIFDEVYDIIKLKRPPEIVDFEVIDDKPLSLPKPK